QATCRFHQVNNAMFDASITCASTVIAKPFLPNTLSSSVPALGTLRNVLICRSTVSGGCSPMVKLNVNGNQIDVDVDPETPLLWVIREQIGLTGTKYGCGIAQCGACSVHIN